MSLNEMSLLEEYNEKKEEKLRDKLLHRELLARFFTEDEVNKIREELGIGGCDQDHDKTIESIVQAVDARQLWRELFLYLFRRHSRELIFVFRKVLDELWDWIESYIEPGSQDERHNRFLKMMQEILHSLDDKELREIIKKFDLGFFVNCDCVVAAAHEKELVESLMGWLPSSLPFNDNGDGILRFDSKASHSDAILSELNIRLQAFVSGGTNQARQETKIWLGVRSGKFRFVNRNDAKIRSISDSGMRPMMFATASITDDSSTASDQSPSCEEEVLQAVQDEKDTLMTFLCVEALDEQGDSAEEAELHYVIDPIIHKDGSPTQGKHRKEIRNSNGRWDSIPFHVRVWKNSAPLEMKMIRTNVPGPYQVVNDSSSYRNWAQPDFFYVNLTIPGGSLSCEYGLSGSITILSSASANANDTVELVN